MPEAPSQTDHRDVLRALPPEVRTGLTERSDRAGLVRLASHVGAIVPTGSWIALGLPLWWAVLPLHGLLLTFLFTLEHECTHRTPFASDRLSDWAGRASGLVLVLPFEWFRYFHLAHHRFTNVEGDPELEAAKPETLPAWLWHVSGVPYWSSAIRLLVRLTLDREAPSFLPAAARGRAVREARVTAGIYALTLASLAVSPLAVWLWILPMLLGQPFLRLYLLAEHGDCPRVANMLANTRTTFTTAFVRWLAWNMPYHVEHHVLPAVPFHRLPDLHRNMRAHLQVTADGYSEFTRDYLARRM
jgi:fatty acid desaturase